MINQDRKGRAKRGDLVQIHVVILAPGERASTLPEATRIVPYEGWVKGFLLDEEAEIGVVVKIESFIGRGLYGILTDINPIYDHNFGEPQPTLNMVGKKAWGILHERGAIQ